ncbi:MAG: metallophosphoesterase family protein [Chthonomonadales bacterium]|nr:metallophosphoesterase family protein [Chthonomonadales bacterium]
MRFTTYGAFIGLVALAATPAQAQVITTNLLTNPGAETGDLSGWTTGGTSNPSVDNGTFDSGINPHSGNFDFVGNSGESGTLTQTINLVGNQGLTAAGIDSGNGKALLSFWEQGLNQSDPSDDAQVRLTFLDGSSGTISFVETPELDSHDGTWKQYTNTYAIPVGTRTIRYGMEFVRHVGNDLDSFVDDNSLIVDTRPAATPEPGSVALLVGMGVSGASFVLRRKRHRK